MGLFGVPTAQLGYAVLYVVATVACFAALVRARRIEDSDTRWGMVGLLVGSGGWALGELAFLVGPTRGLRYGAYMVSLVVGLATVGVWLYFCSAYTGRTLHRDRRYRALAVAVYGSIIALKLTNPLHGLYFRIGYVQEPFAHPTVHHGAIHWIVTGLSYALVAVGFFMLFELFRRADHETQPLAVLVGVTGLPIVFDLVGFTSQRLIDINYEPLGVAVFAVGVLYVFDERFLAVQVTGQVEDAVVYFNRSGEIREFNQQAASLFDGLSGARGDPLETALPEVASTLGADDQILDRHVDGEQRHFLVSEASFSLGQADFGQMIVVTDVTETERRRRELERQNDQLEGFAAAIRHELLNTLQIVGARVSMAGEALDEERVDEARESLVTADRTADRMQTVVDGLAALARHGKTIDETTPVPIEAASDGAFENAAMTPETCRVEGSGQIIAEPNRLQQLLTNGVEFAAHNDAETVTVALGDDRLTITDDGHPLDGVDPQTVFEYGGPIPADEAGMTLPNLEMFARSHGWQAHVDETYEDGIRVVIEGATTKPAANSMEPGGSSG